MPRRKGVRLGGLIAAAITAVLAFAASPASAATVQANCANFNSTLVAATSGETIVLSGMCTGTQAHYTLPSVTDLTIEGASGTTSGFDGTGVASPAITASGSSANGLTLRNLTFQNYSPVNSPAVELLTNSGALPTVDADHFINNHQTGSSSSTPAALLVNDFAPGTCPYTSPLTISNSTFSGNTVTRTTSPSFGGAATVLFFCGSPNTASLKITGNTFTNNSIAGTSGSPLMGAGLYAANGYSAELSAVQAGNVFRSNSITATTPSGSYWGAGEFLGSVNLTSAGDQFIGNSLPGPAGASASSWGAGLSTVRGNCGATAPASATATNLVAVNNTIGAPSAGGSVDGAGIYAGCAPTSGTGGFHLTLINSTVSGNSGPGGTAGVDGEATDQLTLQNSIVHGDSGAGSTELGGFGIGGGTGSITATNSDVCASGSNSAPFAGAGNLCVDPKLVNVAAGDVHETASSPTIDTGSNALVPAGVSTDFYGQPRIVGTKQAAPVVDIGAAEFQTAFNPTGTATISGEKATNNGVQLTITCQGTATQSCNGNVTVTSTEHLTGNHITGVTARKKHHKRTVTVAKGHYSLTGGKSITLKIKLNRKGRKLVKRFGKLPVTVTVTALNAQGKPITVSRKKLKIKKRKHH